MELTQLLTLGVKNQASDLHLSTGLPPMLRVRGDMQRIPTEPLRHEDVQAMLHAVMREDHRRCYAESLECDFACALPGLARFRVNAFQTLRGAAAVFRAIPNRIPTLDQLGAPPFLAELALKTRGLVLVTGPTGSGKSTTLAAMVHHLNQTTARHILTVEDPIEFIHSPSRSLINQREVGAHTLSFANALRSALREDPDVILIGELRDLETIRLALSAAETGHLVLGTLHTSGATKTIDRMIDVFPAEEKSMVRTMLSESLQAVVSQILCKTMNSAVEQELNGETPVQTVEGPASGADGKALSGRVAAYEIMVGTPAIRNLIREGKTAQMYSSLQTGASVGMQTLDQHLAELVRRGLVSAAEARHHAWQPGSF